MRQRTEQKRDAIVAIAAEVFRDFGYERASMSQIAERVGGSKTTLYGYFPSKEELFVEVAHAAAQRQLDGAFAELSLETDDVRAALQRFGGKFLGFVTHPDALAVLRMIIARSGDSDIGRRFLEIGHKPGFTQVQNFLEKCVEAGRLEALDPRVAACHLLGLLQSELTPQRLLGVEEPLTSARTQAVVRRAVEVFIAAYGTEKARARK